MEKIENLSPPKRVTHKKQKENKEKTKISILLDAAENKKPITGIFQFPESAFESSQQRTFTGELR
ncbi:MAG: hypothetical protein E7028_04500 [Planctomycetaceae bacterium]|nr:hypothetical protein [Planctomycetaceae bacterium]